MASSSLAQSPQFRHKHTELGRHYAQPLAHILLVLRPTALHMELDQAFRDSSGADIPANLRSTIWIKRVEAALAAAPMAASADRREAYVADHRHTDGEIREL
jgi:hypothetical protein